MNEAKFTPGEWRASAASSVVGCLIQHGEINVAAAMPQRDKAETEANARLIAAAPELYEACREAFIRIPMAKHNEQVIQMLKVAIAKAEGR